MTKKIGYKATYNFRCQELTYEIGKTYKIDNISICTYGFHYCKNIEDVLEYYDITPDLKIIEIEDIGTKYCEKLNKICTNGIKVLREVPMEEHKLFKFDNKNRLIYYKDEDYIFKHQYDDNDNIVCINTFDSKGNTVKTQEYQYDQNNNMICKVTHACHNIYEDRKEYDKNNNIVYCCKSENGKITYEAWYKYNQNNDIIYHKTSDGDEFSIEYNGNTIKMTDKANRETLKQYDAMSNIIYKKYPNFPEEYYKYDKKNREIYRIVPDKLFEEWNEYDNAGNLIHTKRIKYRGNINPSEEFPTNEEAIVEVWWEYDNNRLVHYKNADGYENWYDYDEKGRMILSKTSTGNLEQKIYDDKDNLISYKNHFKYCYDYEYNIEIN